MSDSLPLLESRTAFARRLGVNTSTITRAAQAGRLVLRGRLVDVHASLTRWQATTGQRPDMTAQHAARRGRPVALDAKSPETALNGAISATKQAKLPSSVSTGESGTEATTERFRGIQDMEQAGIPDQPLESPELIASKAARLRFENATTRLNMALARGERHRLDAVQREAYSLGAAVQAGVERLIDQTAPRLAAERDPAGRAALLAHACAVLGQAITTAFARSARRLRAQGRAA